MDKNAAAERLLALASNDLKRSKTARLRDVIDDVETALSAGVTRANVLTELQALGLDMSLATFDTTLRRLRAKRLASPVTSPAQPATSVNAIKSAPAVSASSGPSDTGDLSHDPADIDRIISSKPDLAALTRIAKRNKQ